RLIYWCGDDPRLGSPHQWGSPGWGSPGGVTHLPIYPNVVVPYPDRYSVSNSESVLKERGKTKFGKDSRKIRVGDPVIGFLLIKENQRTVHRGGWQNPSQKRQPRQRSDQGDHEQPWQHQRHYGL